MNPLPHFAAELLAASAPGLAALAVEQLPAAMLAARQPDHDPAVLWRAHLSDRIADLALALREDSHELFAQQVGWAKLALLSRGMDADHLRQALHALAQVIRDELPQDVASPACACLAAADERWQALSGAQAHSLQTDSPHGRLCGELLVLLLDGHRRDAAEHMTQALAAGQLSPAEALTQVCLPLERELGRMWHLDEITVAEEHFASAAMARIMAGVMAGAERRPANGCTVVAACLAGDDHDLSVSVVADLFELDGWRVVFLGRDLPVQDLVWSASTFGAQLVVLGASLSTHLPTLRQALAALASHAEAEGQSPVPVLVGGPALAANPELAAALGAQAVVLSAGQAVAEGRRLAGLPA